MYPKMANKSRRSGQKVDIFHLNPHKPPLFSVIRCNQKLNIYICCNRTAAKFELVIMGGDNFPEGICRQIPPAVEMILEDGSKLKIFLSRNVFIRSLGRMMQSLHRNTSTRKW
jgi:hypothetical protein